MTENQWLILINSILLVLDGLLFLYSGLAILAIAMFISLFSIIYLTAFEEKHDD